MFDFQVRNAFSKIIVCLAHFALKDGPCPPPLVQGLYGTYYMTYVQLNNNPLVNVSEEMVSRYYKFLIQSKGLIST